MEADSADIIRSPGTPPDQAGSGLATEAGPGRHVTELFRDHHLELVRLAMLMVSDLATALPGASASDPRVAVAW